MARALKGKHVGIQIPADDDSVPRPALRAVQQRVKEEPVSDDVITAAVERAQKNKARAQVAKRERITAKRKQTHAVHETDVHQDNESSRQADSRDEVDRDSEVTTSWRLPSRLDAPPPRPGMVHRWVRYRAGNDEDAEHFEEKLEEGWVPVKRSRAKKVHELTATTHGRYGEYYVKRGLILMEMPEKFAQQRAKYFKQQQAQMNRGVDRNLFKINHRVMPLLQPERSTRTTFQARRGRLDDAVPGDEAEV